MPNKCDKNLFCLQYLFSILKFDLIRLHGRENLVLLPSKRQALKLEGKHEVDQLTDIFAAAAAGDAEIISIINKAALNMGEALGSLVNLLDPELVVLGGMLVYEYEPFYAIAKDAAENKCLRVSKDIQMARGKLRYKAGVIGAGEIVADTFFSKTVNDLLSKEKE